jgi:cobalt-zinc-cadmium efflux system outer membrane protein
MIRPTVVRTVAYFVALALLLGVSRANGQAPTLLPESMPEPGSTRSTLPPSPGSGAVPFNNAPGAGADVLGGRVGTAFPRVPTTATTPTDSRITPQGGRQQISPVPTLPIGDVAPYGPLDLPSGTEGDGPPHGLTLDMAIERMIKENLDLRSRYFEIPQAEADILTASLRANPLFYADSQLIPYGQYSTARPGGPLQYDINITYPLDVTHKRRARTLVAIRAKHVLEAQYQEAVRMEIDNLYRAFVDVLAARETVRFREASVASLGKLVDATQKLYEKSNTTSADLNRLVVLRNSAEILLAQDQEAMRRAKRVLAPLLNIPPTEAETMEIRGTIFDRATLPPLGDELLQIALSDRPDLNSYRLGVNRAQADVKLARANRLQDIYLLYQPYTFQNNQPFGTRSPTSWAIGMTVPLPLYNRNQGNIQRSLLNVSQSQVELTAIERRVITDVRQAERDYAITRQAVEEIQQKLLPPAKKMRDDEHVLYVSGETDVIRYLNAENYYNEALRVYRDTLVRHRRSMLGLNTAVGRRILP